MLAKRWIDQEVPSHLKDALCSELGVSPATAVILINRGVKTAAEADTFMAASLDDLVEPFRLEGMDRAVARVKRALDTGEKILVFGDYDADGVTSTALLVHFFRILGREVPFYIPVRQEEGYGMTVEALKRIKEMGVGLIITVDCGVSSVDEIDAASRMGMDVIVTDHHEPPEELPRACVILNPLLKGSAYPFKGLAGVGVALKFAQGVLAGLEGKDKAGPGVDTRLMGLLDLVALGTIADVVPLRGENRILARHGLKLIRDGKRIGVASLKDVAMQPNGKMTSSSVGFQLAPRLNAAGRIGRADRGVRLLTTEDPVEAHDIAVELDSLNRERQKIEGGIHDEARSELLSMMDEGARSIVLYSDSWHQGVIGIVASKLVEEFYRPTVLIAMNNGVGRGSGRSIPSFHLHDGLKRCGRLLEAYGGHEFAAGLSIRREMLDEFAAEFERIVCESLGPDDFVPSLKVDAELELQELSWDFHREIANLAPFGSGNPEPVLKARGLEVLYPKVVGRNHVRMKVRQRGFVMDSIGFNMGDIYQDLAMKRVTIDAAFCLDANEWQGDRTLQLNIKDIHF